LLPTGSGTPGTVVVDHKLGFKLKRTKSSQDKI